jgi:geranylgeranyl diphosphate synthase type I
MISQNELLKKINWQLNSIVRGTPERLYDASKHLIKSGGKRIRPIICLMSCQAVNGKIENALRSAAAIELIHTFTLIHDDIMDEDDLRRGSPSVHKIFGEETAILAGDLLFSKAFEICDAKVKDVLARASVEICEGQQMDLSFETRDGISEREYLEMIEKKTSTLFEASSKAGAILGDASEEITHSFANYGKNLGMAFQVYDDLLEIIGNEEKIGKPVGSDISQGKKSLVIVKALEQLSVGDEKEKLFSILKKKGNSKEEIQEALFLIKKSGAVEYCKEKAQDYVEKAKNSLKEIPGSDAKKTLLEIADFVVERKK